MDFTGLVDPTRDSLAATRTIPIDSARDQISSVASLGEDFELFLQILTTQLRNQDPLNPVESEQFVDQLTQFSQLEQQVRTNDELQAVQSELRVGAARQDALLVGREVQALSDLIGFDGTDPVVFQVVAARAGEATITIVDDSGTPVRTVTGPVDQGSNFVVWDGTNDGGTPVAPGNYRVSHTARDIEGAAVETQTVVSALVDEVRFGLGGSTFLLSSGGEVGAEEIIRIGG